MTPEEEFAREGRERPLASGPVPAPPVISGGTIEGRIVVPAEAEAAAREGVLFLLVRAEGASGGPPLAVQRHERIASPMAFAIGPADAMLAGTSFPERVTVTARLDGDGDPLTTGPEDWAAVSEAVSPGTTELELRLSPAEPS